MTRDHGTIVKNSGLVDEVSGKSDFKNIGKNQKLEKNSFAVVVHGKKEVSHLIVFVFYFQWYLIKNKDT